MRKTSDKSLLGIFSYWFRRRGKRSGASSAGLELKTREAQSEILIESIPDGVVLFSPKGSITLANPAAAKMTEWPVDEALGIDIRTVMHLAKEDGKPLEHGEDLFGSAINNKQRVGQTLMLKGRGGQKSVIISLTISPIIDSKSQEVMGAVAVFRDISQARKEEQQRAEFISTASHEMRTPVAAIEGYLALALNDQVSKIDSKARDYLEKAHASTQHLGKLFQDLLTSARAEDGRLVSHPVVVDMGSFLEQLSDNMKFTAEKKGLFIEFIVGAGTDSNVTGKVVKPLYYVQVDPDRVSEALTNLIDNAIKYTESGKISIGLTGNNEVVQIFIKDTGPGIPVDDIPHLFQKFYRVDNTATRTIGGTGLGLFICRKIIELYNGRIWVESEEGKGSTFFINLPRLDSQKVLQLKAEVASQPASPLDG